MGILQLSSARTALFALTPKLERSAGAPFAKTIFAVMAPSFEISYTMRCG